jgi:hypothetical protein
MTTGRALSRLLVQICLHIFNAKGHWISDFILEELQFYLKQSGKNRLMRKDKVAKVELTASEAYTTNSYRIAEQYAHLIQKVSPNSYIHTYILFIVQAN